MEKEYNTTNEAILKYRQEIDQLKNEANAYANDGYHDEAKWKTQEMEKVKKKLDESLLLYDSGLKDKIKEASKTKEALEQLIKIEKELESKVKGFEKDLLEDIFTKGFSGLTK